MEARRGFGAAMVRPLQTHVLIPDLVLAPRHVPLGGNVPRPRRSDGMIWPAAGIRPAGAERDPRVATSARQVGVGPARSPQLATAKHLHHRDGLARAVPDVVEPRFFGLRVERRQSGIPAGGMVLIDARHGGIVCSCMMVGRSGAAAVVFCRRRVGGADKRRHDRPCHGSPGARATTGSHEVLIEIELVVERHLLDLREDQRLPRPAVLPLPPVRARTCLIGTRVVGENECRARQHLTRTVVVVQSHGQLLQVVAAGDPTCRFPGRLDGRQKQADERSDDRDHDEKFHESETRRRRGMSG